MQETLARLREHGMPPDAARYLLLDFTDLVGLPEMQRLEERFSLSRTPEARQA